MAIYKTGSSSEQIRLSVDVRTIGFAESQALILSNEENKYIPVARSKDITGYITGMPIGSAPELQSQTLHINTEITLHTIADIEARKAEYNRISAVYTLDNGKDGRIVFPRIDQISSSEDYSSVRINTAIKLR